MIEWLSHWEFWLAVLNIIGFIVIFFFNKFSHDKIVGNDLHHIAADIKSIMNVQGEQGKNITSLGEDVAYLKGTLNVPLIKRMKKTNIIK